MISSASRIRKRVSKVGRWPHSPRVSIESLDRQALLRLSGSVILESPGDSVAVECLDGL